MSSPYLPPEILDYITDLLRNELETLGVCCFVSKSWVPRTRRHLFASIEFRSANAIDLWKKTFPDPSDSPAYHARILTFRCAQTVVAAGTGEGGWIQSFSRVVELELAPDDDDLLSSFGNLERTSLVPFHNFSPIKWLRMGSMTLPYPQIFTLIRSFPLLEHLSLIGHDTLLGDNSDPNGPQTSVPLALPALTGSLSLVMIRGIENTAQRLLNLSGGLRFRKFMFSWILKGDLRWIMELVVRCSDTLEYLDIRCRPPCMFVPVICWSNCLLPSVGDSGPASIDLSKAKKLGGVEFWPGSPKVGWVITALQTITPEHQDLRCISIYAPRTLAPVGVDDNVRRTVGEQIWGQWLELDRVLVQFWESRSIRPKVVCVAPEKEWQDRMRASMGSLLPEITRRGIIYLF